MICQNWNTRSGRIKVKSLSLAIGKSIMFTEDWQMFTKTWATSDWKSADQYRVPLEKQPCWHSELCPAISSYYDWGFPWFSAVTSHIPKYKLETGSSLHPTKHRELSQCNSRHAPSTQVTMFLADTLKLLSVYVSNFHPLTILSPTPPPKKIHIAICRQNYP